MNKFELQYKIFGDQSIIIEWEKKIDEIILDDIISLRQKIIDSKLFLLDDIVVGYNSMTLIFESNPVDFKKNIKELKKLYKTRPILNKVERILWKIPVCYDRKFGIDLNEITNNNCISMEEIIHLHTKMIYTVFFIGFLPGFLYLGGLDKKLHIDRKDTPRLEVSRGSVAIGGSQTGIYPMESPGGWHIIGRTPVSFFDVNKTEPCFAKPGDKLKFYSISEKEYLALEREVSTGKFNLKKEVL
ncbi:MAG TPA: allophanate hydrolase [Tenacibaculum sp.]|nr:allophanate hydrolase [Tenacibaculum sp.]